MSSTVARRFDRASHDHEDDSRGRSAGACPKCGKLPETVKSGSYWFTRCATAHLFKVAGHVMKSKREAIHEWNVAHKAQ